MLNITTNPTDCRSVRCSQIVKKFNNLGAFFLYEQIYIINNHLKCNVSEFAMNWVNNHNKQWAAFHQQWINLKCDLNLWTLLHSYAIKLNNI